MISFPLRQGLSDHGVSVSRLHFVFTLNEPFCNRVPIDLCPSRFRNTREQACPCASLNNPLRGDRIFAHGWPGLLGSQTRKLQTAAGHTSRCRVACQQGLRFCCCCEVSMCIHNKHHHQPWPCSHFHNAALGGPPSGRALLQNLHSDRRWLQWTASHCRTLFSLPRLDFPLH